MTEAEQPRKEQSDVTVTFKDGEVKVYHITAGPGIARYLTAEAGQSGILTLWNGDSSYGIPLASIRDWMISRVHEEPKQEANE